MPIDNAILIAGTSAAASSIATVVAMRVDIGWIKRTLDKLDKRMTQLESKLF
ncbi:hypothetical protein [Vibrio tritonius]|uniref:hypothetical protein n=1 Tax=Vibrio tritonius TaxID=1435069 RepID=UPI00315CFAE1